MSGIPQQERPPARDPWWPGALLALLVALVLTAVLLHPLLRDPWGSIAGNPRSEILDGLWTFTWVQDSLLEEHALSLRVQGATWPQGAVIYPLGMINALLALPARPLLGAVGAFNAATAGCFVLTFMAAWALFRRVGGDSWAALPGAFAVALSPSWLNGFSLGLVEEWTLGWALLALLVVLGPRRRLPLAVAATLSALALAVATFANAYYGMFAACAAAWLVLTRPGLTWRPRLTELGIMGALTALLTAPLAWVVHFTTRHPDSMVMVRAPEQVRDMIQRVAVVDIVDVVLPLSWFGRGEGHASAYLGVVAVVTGAWAMVRCRAARRWAWLGLGALVFGLGGTLVVAGWTPTVAGHTLPLPARWLCLHLPPFTFIAHPFRALTILSVCLGAAMALWLGGVGSPRFRRLLALALCAGIVADLVWLSPAHLPALTQPVLSPAFYLGLRDDPEPYGVLDVPVPSFSVDRSRYLHYQRLHRKWTPYALDHQLPALRGEPEVMRFLDALSVRAEEQGIGPGLRPGSTEGSCGGAARLPLLGFRYLVLHRYLLDEQGAAAFEEAIEACVDRVVYEDDELMVWGLQPS
jgi:hypothetical protein